MVPQMHGTTTYPSKRLELGAYFGQNYPENDRIWFLKRQVIVHVTNIVCRGSISCRKRKIMVPAFF